MSTFTSNKYLELPASGAYVGTWDIPVNADMTVIDTALGGYTVINPTGLPASTITLTPTQYRPPNIVFGTSLTAAATLTANLNYQLPSGVGGQWTIYNNTTGAYSITISSAGGGTSIQIAQGVRTLVVSDGTNVSFASTAATSGAGGNDTQIQFNSSGALTGSSNLTYNGTALALTGNMGVTGPGVFTGALSSSSLTVTGIGTFTGAVTASAFNGAVGTVTPSTGAFTTLTSTGGALNGTIGATTPNTGSFSAITLATALAVAQGGTGASTAAAAFANIAVATSLLATSGYIKLTNGLIFQWGQYTTLTSPDGTITITFPLVFPSACFTFLCSPVVDTYATGTDSWLIQSGVASVTSATIRVASSANAAQLKANWFAIGN
jgi:hypothetical protein